MAVIWEPQPKQADFMARGEWEALYGGAAGGGKSEALVIEALRQVHIPWYKGIIFRKTFPEARELIEKSQKYYRRAVPGARYNATEHTWRFPSGATIEFGSMQHTTERTKYQGRAFDFVAFDELTHFSWDEYSYLFSRCRPNGPGTECYIRATANPGGIGHSWVKQRFIDSGKPLETVWDRVSWVDLDGHEQSAMRSRVFVPSTVFDNPALLSNDPGYVASLASMPEAEKQALLYGDWNTFSGQVYCEWTDDPEHYEDRKKTHVIHPFKVPEDWAVWCGLDWGYAKPFAVGWFAVDHDRKMYMIKEWYGCTGTPDTGIKLEPHEVARYILELERNDPNLKGRRIHRVGDPAIWGSQSGQSIGDMMSAEGVYFEKGDHARIDGKMQLHYRLAFDDNDDPMLQVFDTCRHFIRTLPSLVYDETYVEDVDTDGEDHLYDMTRYVCMANPIAPPQRKAEEIRPYNPLDTDLDIDIQHDRYAWYRIRR